MARGAGEKKEELFISALSDWWKMVLLTEMVEPQGGAWGAVLDHRSLGGELSGYVSV